MGEEAGEEMSLGWATVLWFPKKPEKRGLGTGSGVKSCHCPLLPDCKAHGVPGSLGDAACMGREAQVCPQEESSCWDLYFEGFKGWESSGGLREGPQKSIHQVYADIPK